MLDAAGCERNRRPDNGNRLIRILENRATCARRTPLDTASAHQPRAHKARSVDISQGYPDSVRFSDDSDDLGGAGSAEWNCRRF